MLEAFEPHVALLSMDGSVVTRLPGADANGVPVIALPKIVRRAGDRRWSKDVDTASTGDSHARRSGDNEEFVIGRVVRLDSEGAQRVARVELPSVEQSIHARTRIREGRVGISLLGFDDPLSGLVKDCGLKTKIRILARQTSNSKWKGFSPSMKTQAFSDFGHRISNLLIN